MYIVLTQWVEILSEEGDIIMVNGFILEKNVPGRKKENRWSCLRLAYKIAQLIRTISTQIGLNSSGKSQMAPTIFFSLPWLSFLNSFWYILILSWCDLYLNLIDLANMNEYYKIILWFLENYQVKFRICFCPSK